MLIWDFKLWIWEPLHKSAFAGFLQWVHILLPSIVAAFPNGPRVIKMNSFKGVSLTTPTNCEVCCLIRCLPFSSFHGVSPLKLKRACLAEFTSRWLGTLVIYAHIHFLSTR